MGDINFNGSTHIAGNVMSAEHLAYIVPDGKFSTAAAVATLLSCDDPRKAGELLRALDSLVDGTGTTVAQVRAEIERQIDPGSPPKSLAATAQSIAAGAASGVVSQGVFQALRAALGW